MTDQAMEARARARAVWSAGNWDEVAKMLPPAGARVLELAQISAGMDVVDVGCGSGGTIAIPAAQMGANVTGIDVAPEHFNAARRRAEEARVEVTWFEGDAADLPVPDQAFDRVLSTFGHAFAADQVGTANELVRVCRPDGWIVCAMWTPEGLNGQFFQVIGKRMPPPPPGFQSPILWGTEQRWHELVGSQGFELEFHREMLVFEKPSVDQYAAEMESNFGPLVTARATLGDEAFAAIDKDFKALLHENNEVADGSMRISAEFLVAIARR